MLLLNIMMLTDQFYIAKNYQLKINEGGYVTPFSDCIKEVLRLPL